MRFKIRPAAAAAPHAVSMSAETAADVSTEGDVEASKKEKVKRESYHGDTQAVVDILAPEAKQ